MHGMEFLIPIAFFTIIYMIVRTVSENRTKRQLIDRGLVDEKAKMLFTTQMRDNPLQSLKWGLVLIGIGVALAVGEMFPRTFTEGGVMGLMMLFAGLAFIVYFVLAKKKDQTGA